MSNTDDLARITVILDFWLAPEHAPYWFESNADFDRKISQDFADDHERAAAGDLIHWEATAPGALALVIALDQFPRNLYRDDPRTYATDAAALAVAERAIGRGLDQSMTITRRKFLYMPFQHSESVTDQRRSIDLFASLDDPDTLEFAERHRRVVERFGRFPHRNGVLGRDSTPEELAFLASDEAPY